MKLNKRLLPVKLHYFFFNAGMGPVLPFIPVFAKQLGISEIALGSFNFILPLLVIVCKPFFGFLLDYFHSKRKIIFISVIFSTSVIFCSMAFIPNDNITKAFQCSSLEKCGEQTISESRICEFMCQDKNISEIVIGFPKANANDVCLVNGKFNCSQEPNKTCNIFCPLKKSDSFYIRLPFWIFVLTVTLGNIGYTVSNALSDAICFNVLGEGEDHRYGQQRVWGSISFGLTAILGAYLISHFQQGETVTSMDYLPAFIVAIVCTVIDLICCCKLQLPPLEKSDSIIKDTATMVKKPHISIFIGFAVIVGMCDSSVIFYLLWFIEDLAKDTNFQGNLKLLEGLTIGVETLCGEVIIFPIAGKIIEKLGHANTFTLCFAIYSFRLALIASIPSPWWIIPVEIFLQGPTYALLYATVVAYANAVAPPGTSATVQGLVGGMDDGFGFALGNIIGGVIYSYFGGRVMFSAFSILALTASISHCILHRVIKKYSDINAQEKLRRREVEIEADALLASNKPKIQLRRAENNVNDSEATPGKSEVEKTSLVTEGTK